MSIPHVSSRRSKADTARSFGNWAVQRCLEAAATAEERRKIVTCMRYVLLVSYLRAALISIKLVGVSSS